MRDAYVDGNIYTYRHTVTYRHGDMYAGKPHW